MISYGSVDCYVTLGTRCRVIRTIEAYNVVQYDWAESHSSMDLHPGFEL